MIVRRGFTPSVDGVLQMPALGFSFTESADRLCALVYYSVGGDNVGEVSVEKNITFQINFTIRLPRSSFGRLQPIMELLFF